MKAEMIAPCGLNCALCGAHMRKKNPCPGCNAPFEQKTFAHTSCKIVNCEKRNENGWATCANCDRHCRRLKDLNKRYSTKYHTNLAENLAAIREQGMDSFLLEQERKYTCRSCGSFICMHTGTCPKCGTTLEIVEE